MVVVDLEHVPSPTRGMLEVWFGEDDDIMVRHDRSPAAIVMLELDPADPAKTLRLVPSIRKTQSTAEIFILVSRPTSELMLEIMRSGAKEVLAVPPQRTELRDALGRYRDRRGVVAAAPGERHGQLYAVLSAKGGVGVSTVAVNLAAAFQQQHEGRMTSLVDLNIAAPELPLFLDIGPQRSFQDLAADVNRIDAVFLKSILSKHALGLYVLPFAHDEEVKTELTPECAEHTLSLLATMFDRVVVDCGQRTGVILPVLERADAVLIVTTLHVPAIRRTKRLLESMTEDGWTGDRVKIVINRYNPIHAPLLKNAEDVLGRKVLTVVPEDEPAVTMAINNGQPLVTVAPKSETTQAFEKLAETLSGGPRGKDMSGFAGYLKSVGRLWSRETSAAR